MVSLTLAVHHGDSVLIEFDDQHVGAATYGTVFDIMLMPPSGNIQRHDDLFATIVANITCFVFDFAKFH